MRFLTLQKKHDKTPINWNSKAIESFEQLKKSIAAAALLAFPQDGALLRVCTDSSDSAMGAVLEQQTADQCKPLPFFSRKFDRPQRGYSTFDRELTAIVEAVKHFMYYLEGVAFIGCTDHKPLLSILTQLMDTTLARRRRKVEFLSIFDMTLEYLPVPENAVADTLSRLAEAEPQSVACSESADPPTWANDDELSVGKFMYTCIPITVFFCFALLC
uniref:Reverse transcriptase/retrotransposon-derived protein RNase H-like domain-containing protein n=1 Tax=Trichogramma kaykai TaxID=54128 RepID=A0ABD2X058_9HYME